MLVLHGPVRRWILAAALACVPVLSVCVDGVAPTLNGRSAQFALAPTMAGGVSALGAAPINRVRISAFLSPSDLSLGVTVQDVDPNARSWSLVFDVAVPIDLVDPLFYVTLELINVTGGVETVEFSGRSATQPLVLAKIPEIREVPVVRGPLGNLDVTRVTIQAHPGTAVEGDSMSLRAVATTGSGGGATVYWTSASPAVASVSGDGVVRTLAPGVASVVATAGAKADTASIQVTARPVAVTLSEDSVELHSLDEEVTLAGAVVDARGDPVPGTKLTWEVESPAVLAHLGEGVFKALSVGTSKVVARSSALPELKAEAVVSVRPMAATVEISPPEAYLAKAGDKVTLTASGVDANGHPVAQAEYAWTSLAPAVATVDSDGAVTAVSNGTARIVAGTPLGADTALVTVGGNLASVAVTPAVHAFTEFGQTVDLQARALDTDGAPIESISLFRWTSANPEVAAVDAEGRVTAVGDGVTTVSASVGDVSGEAEITVGRIVSTVVVTPARDTLTAVGATTKLVAVAQDAEGVPIETPATWTSSDTTVVRVDDAGLVTAVGDGSAVVTARVNGVEGAATVVVRRVVSSVLLAPESFGFKFKGETQAFSAVALDAGGVEVAADFTWRSSRTTVASVTQGGVVTAVGNGVATISASAGGVEGTSSITVGIEIGTVVLTPGTQSFASEGETHQITAVAYDLGGSVIPAVTSFSWKSSNLGVATVDGTGMVTAVGDGAAVITAQAGGVSGTASVTVTRQVAGVTVSPDPPPALVFFGQQIQLSAQAVDALGNPLPAAMTWTSLDTPVATVGSTGLVTAVSNGTARIVAASGGFADTVTVTVNQGVSYITVTPRAQTFIAVAETQTFSALAYDAGGNVVASVTSFAWTTDDGGVATVGVPNGATTVVTATGDGTTVLKASSGGVSGEATVRVSSTPASITVTPGAPKTLTTLGETLAMTATVRDILGNVVSASVGWSSLTPAVASVSPTTGLVTALQNGTAKVVASTGSLADTVTVTVTQAVGFIDVTPGSRGFTSSGDTVTLAATAYDAGGTAVTPTPTITWASSAPAVATVNPSTGLVTSVADGSATIKASAGGAEGTASITVGLVVSSVVVTPDTATLTSKGATRQYSAVAKDALGNDLPSVTSFTWSSTDAGVATVNAAGLVTAVADGAATITASVGGKQDGASVTVARAVKAVTVTPASPPALVSLGSTVQLKAVVTDTLDQPMPETVTWASSDGAVATVNASTGLVTAVSNGSVTITASAGGVDGSVTVDVAQAVGRVEVTPGSRGFTSAAETQAFTAVAYDGGGVALVPQPTFTWASSDDAVATVDGTGLVTSVANGTATITASTAGGSGQASVTVGLAVASIDVTPDTATLVSKGETRLFTAVALDGLSNPIPSVTTFTWSSSDAGVATVDATGLVRAVSDGTATITAEAGGQSNTASVTVARVVDAVTVTPSSPPTLGTLGETVQLDAVATDALGEPMDAVVTWGSSDPGVASVTGGLVTAVADGTVTIMATAGGVDGTVDVTVAQAVAAIDVTPATTTLSSAGATQLLTATGRDASGNPLGTPPTFAWTSSNPGVATVDPSTGLVTSVADGSTTITASAGGVDGTASVTVDQSAGSVTISPATPATLTYVGETVQLTADVRDASNQPYATTVTWTSLTPTVATVDASGLVTARADGTAKIAASTGGPADTVSVAVAQAVASVEMSAASVAMTAGASGLQLSATALDQGGATVAGASFTWASNNTGVVTVDGSGFITPVADGTTTVDATASGVSGSTSVQVTSGAVARTFTGGSSGDLLDPANWEPSGVPGPTDSLVISAGAESTPTLTGDFAIGTLVIAAGAELDIGDFNLTVSGDLASGGTISGTGTVTMAGTDAAISGTVPNLLVTGSVTATGDVTVNGDFTIDGNSSTFDLGSETVAISGDLTTDNGAVLAMSDPAATLDIEGDLLLGGGDTNGTLSDGTLYLSGELVTVSVSFKTFNPDGNHTVVLNGTTEQHVFLYFPGERNNRFQNLVIDNPAGVVFETDIPVLGDATILQGTVRSLAGTPTTTWLYGDLNDAAGGRWQVDATFIEGATPSLPASLKSDVTFETSTALQTDVTVDGNVVVTGSGANLDLNGHDLTATGDFTTSSSALFTMTDGASDLTVQGTASFGGGNTTGLLTAGRLRVQGDLAWIGNKVYTFAPTGTHEVIFSGTTPQQILLTAGGGRVYAIQNLRIDASAAVTMTEGITVNGDMILDGTFTIPASKTLVIAGTLTDNGTLVNNGTLTGG